MTCIWVWNMWKSHAPDYQVWNLYYPKTVMHADRTILLIQWTLLSGPEQWILRIVFNPVKIQSNFSSSCG